MVFYITNKNADLSFPALLHSQLINIMLDNKDGATEMAVELNTAQDFLSLDSLCRICNDWYRNMSLSGNCITLNEGGKYDTGL